jgi:hypothetical protein
MSRSGKKQFLIPRLLRAGSIDGPSKMIPLLVIVVAGASLAGAVLRLLWKRRMRGDRSSGDRASGSAGQTAIETPPGGTAPAVSLCGEASVPSKKPCIPILLDGSALESGVTESHASKDSGPTISIQVGGGPDAVLPQTHPPDSPQETKAVVALSQSEQGVSERPLPEEPIPAPETGV